MAIDDCAKAGEVRATAMTVASASRFMAFSTATGASFYRKYYADGIPRAAPGMRGTIRSGSLAAYCVHSPRDAKRLDRLNLHSRTGEITAARHPEAARESNQGLATARALGLNAPLFYELRPELHAGWLPGADLFGARRHATGIGCSGRGEPSVATDTRLRRIMIFGPKSDGTFEPSNLAPQACARAFRPDRLQFL